MAKNDFNRLKEFHEFLKNTNTKKFQSAVDAVCKELDISLSSYYRKMAKPNESFSNAEKKAIAQIYGLPVHFIFQELEE
jgi:hypothetical protein